MVFNGGFDDDTNTLLASPTCEADPGMSGIGRYGEFSFGDRSDLPVCGRHRGPRCFQCSRANGIGAADLCWQGRQCLAAAGSLCRRRKIRRQRHGILDQGEDGATDACRSCDRVPYEVDERARENVSPFRTSSVPQGHDAALHQAWRGGPRNSTCHFLPKSFSASLSGFPSRMTSPKPRKNAVASSAGKIWMNWRAGA
jgi:hypothetical protein